MFNYHLQGNRSRTKRHDIPVSEIIYGGMSKAELLQAQEQEHQLAHQDKLMEQTKDRKNELEAYVYEVRNKVISNSLLILPHKRKYKKHFHFFYYFVSFL